MKKKTALQKADTGFSIPGAELFIATTYSADRPLFKALGLQPFTRIPINVEYFVGEVKFKNTSIVKIWVRPTPAQFWRFEIHLADNDSLVKVSTGSGTMTDFWSFIKLIADGMLVIE